MKPIPAISLPVDYNAIRVALVREIIKVTALTQNQVIVAEAEAPNLPRPQKPYFSMKIVTPGFKYGDDSKQEVPGTTNWQSYGPRKMTVAFDVYGNSHEEAYNYMATWNAALDRQDIQEDLRAAGIAVWIIGQVADLSQLLNTGYEGRAHMECEFGITYSTQSDLGEMQTVTVDGTVTTDQGQEESLTETVTTGG